MLLPRDDRQGRPVGQAPRCANRGHAGRNRIIGRVPLCADAAGAAGWDGIMILRSLALGLCAAGAMVMATPQAQSADSQSLGKIKHVLVIYLENRSFDNIYGLFPGANGIANSRNQDGTQKFPQLDHTGAPYATLPPVLDTNRSPTARDARFKENLPNGPFLINSNVKDGGSVGTQETTGDSIH
eukprot:gene24372-26151_t